MMTGTTGSHAPRGFGRFAKSLVVGTAVLGLLIGGRTSALARVQLRPQVFALSPAVFPAGSLVVRAGVESNTQLARDSAGHFGIPSAALGRLTGYYMDTVQGDPTAPSRTYTSYLVSIFSSGRQARLAFDLRWDTWYRTDYYTSPPSIGIVLGDRGDQALFRTLDPQVPRTSELFFRKGAILVEIFQGTGSAEATAIQVHSLYAIAVGLSHLAGAHPHGR